MKVIDTDIEGVKIVEPDRIGDERGWFCEQYNEERYAKAGICARFVQDNESFSRKGVIRGLHWQAAPHTQAKLVRVIRGAVWDVAVDIRRGSPTFGRHVAVTLSAENRRQFFIPRGFAHGFLVLEDDTLFVYKCDNYYAPQAEGSYRWNDPFFAIDWGISPDEVILSEKDARAPFIKDASGSL